LHNSRNCILTSCKNSAGSHIVIHCYSERTRPKRTSILPETFRRSVNLRL